MTIPLHAPLSSRACQAAARVFAFDPMLARAFEQLDADVQIERSSAGRRADMRAWLALLRLLFVAVPTTMTARVLELPHSARSVLFRVGGRLLIGAPGAVAISGLLSTAWPAASSPRPLTFSVWFTLMFAWMLTAELVQRIARRHIGGGLIVMLLASALMSLATHFVAVPLAFGAAALDIPDLVFRGLLHPVLAVETAWLSAQLALRGRSMWDEVSTMAVVGVVIAGGVLPATIVVHQLNDTQLAVLCLALVPLSLLVTAALSSRIARHPVVAES